MLVKIHKDVGFVIAICDKDLIGKTFSEGEIEIKVSEHFYGGEEKTKEEVIEVMKSSDNLNLIGEEAVGLAVELRIIDKNNVIKIQGVPHAQRVSC